MGLAVVHGIVQNHGGVIKVDSAPSRGTRFDIFFPKVQFEQAEVSKIEDTLPGGTEHILFVDDEKALVELHKKTLEMLGYRVTIRTSPIEALEAFRAQPNKFDLLISDMTMPNMTGDILAQKILAIRPDFPIILCTGYSEDKTEQRVKALGIEAFVMKPLVRKDLSQTIRKALDHQSGTASSHAQS
jgi:CheY-like chemotaxis protein